ncbi:MAG: hypothetical protein AAF202_04115 [Pseudomonadota bacterium]
MTREVFSINTGEITSGFVRGSPEGVRPEAFEVSLEQPIEEGDEVKFGGHVVMQDADGIDQVYYRIFHSPAGISGFDPIEQEVSINPDATQGTSAGPESQELFIRAADLIRTVGDDVAGCEVLPRDALARQEEDRVRPRRRPRDTLAENLRDIAALRDGLLDDLDIQVPDISIGRTIENYDSLCRGFIAGENELGPWGELIVSEIIGENRGERYHSDVDPQYFFNVPSGYFGDSCPNFNSMTTGQKLGAWVTILTRLAQEESSCEEDAVNRRGTHTHAEGLFQGNANWETFVAPNGDRILGRQNRGAGCDAETTERGRWLLDYEDAITCAIQGLGDVSCGGFSRNFGVRPVCRPQSRPQSFFGRSSISNQYYGPLKGTAPHDRPKQRRIKAALRRVPGCVE